MSVEPYDAPAEGCRGGEARVAVAAPTAADEDDFIRATRASAALHHPWIAPPTSRDGYRDWLARTRRSDQATYLFRHVECGGLVGYASVSNIVRRALQSGYLGYGAFVGHERRGLMTTGLREVLADVFVELGLHRVEANIQPGNAPSLAVARRLGFTREGFSRRYLVVDGDWRDHERWALLAEDLRP